MEKCPQIQTNDPKTGSYPINVKGLFHRKPEPINMDREPNWSVDSKAKEIVTTIIIIAFAVLVIGAVFGAAIG